jgi:hypothetical protein
VLIVGKTTYDLPLPSGLARKWDAVERHLDYLVLAERGHVAEADARFDLAPCPHGRLSTAIFHAGLARRVRRATKSLLPDAIIVQSPFEGAAAMAGLRFTRHRPKLIVEIHGDWRSAARLYGSSLRRVLAPVAERIAALVLRRADGTRAVGPYAARLAQEITGTAPLGVFPTYSRSDGPSPQGPLQSGSGLWSA